MSSMLRRESVVRAASEDEVVSCSLAGEAALLSLRHGTYYGLDTVGAYVWELSKSGASVAQIHHALLQRFEVESKRCEDDLIALLDDMAQADLLTVQQPPEQPKAPAQLA